LEDTWQILNFTMYVYTSVIKWLKYNDLIFVITKFGFKWAEREKEIKVVTR
jgi:hypothetical protein